MNQSTHDPREFVRGIHQIFISDKKRIGFLFGAGSSLATNIPSLYVPAVLKMTEIIVAELEKSSTKNKKALAEIKNEIEEKRASGGETFHIESLLSALEAKREVIGGGSLNGLDAAGFSALAVAVKEHVKRLVSIHEKLKADQIITLPHWKLANWIAKARRTYPAEIYTTNYDYLFEIALEALGIPYFDAFAGSYEPFFCPEAVEDLGAYSHLPKLWKLHGSLGWKRRASDDTVVRDKNAKIEDLMIFPSYLKYTNSKKQPYVGLIDRLCAFLQQDDAVLITCGYSFGDRHINERIATSLRRGGNSHVIAMYFDEVKGAAGKMTYTLSDPSNNVRKMAINETNGKMSAYGIRHAVIGGRFGEWKLRGEPSADDSIKLDRYFDQDAAMPGGVAGEQKGTEQWLGTGRFLLPNFVNLGAFLDSLSPGSAVYGMSDVA